MHTVGVDIVEIPRVQQAIERFGDRFLHRIYTERELLFCRGRVSELAARFAAKEAVMKALGTGVRGVGCIKRGKTKVPDRPAIKSQMSAGGRIRKLGGNSQGQR